MSALLLETCALRKALRGDNQMKYMQPEASIIHDEEDYRKPRRDRVWQPCHAIYSPSTCQRVDCLSSYGSADSIKAGAFLCLDDCMLKTWRSGRLKAAILCERQVNNR